MESTGEAGRIQMTEDTKVALEHDILLTRRVRRRPGLVDVKGQSKMRTYWLYTDADFRALARNPSTGSYSIMIS